MRVMRVLELIGNTPIVKVNKLNKNKKVNIYAKLEGFNPSGSVKDRIALKMIEQAEGEGVLTEEKTIIEATSGNTGIGIALRSQNMKDLRRIRKIGMGLFYPAAQIREGGEGSLYDFYHFMLHRKLAEVAAPGDAASIKLSLQGASELAGILRNRDRVARVRPRHHRE